MRAYAVLERLVVVMVMVMVVMVGAEGKSIDNPAEASPNPRSLGVPPPVQVTSGVLTVGGGDHRRGRVMEVGEDGIPIIHGVRMPDDPSDTKIYRNARIINNQLWTLEDEVRANQLVQGRANTQSSPGARQPRILTQVQEQTHGAFFPSPATHPTPSPSLGGQGATGVTKYPAFYYRHYYDNERTGVVAESSAEGEDNISSSSDKVVSYSYLAAPQTQSASKKTSTGHNVVYGTGAASKPLKPSQSDPSPSRTNPSPQLLTASSIFGSRKENPLPSPTSSLSLAASQLQPSHSHIVRSTSDASLSQPQPSHSHITRSSSDISLSNPSPFGHTQQTFAVYHQQGLATHPTPHPSLAPHSVFPANPAQFIIKDSTFQSHPGAPAFSVPIPVPNHQLKAGSSYVNYEQHRDAQKPLYQRVMDPFMRMGNRIYQAATPMFGPMMKAGQRLSDRLRIRQRVSSWSNTLKLDSMNDYISRTVDDENLPVAAGVLAIATLALVGLGIAATSNVTIGKRSIDDDYNYYPIVDELMDEGRALGGSVWGLLDTTEGKSEEGAGTTDGGGSSTTGGAPLCSRRLLCDVMMLLPPHFTFNLEKRIDGFLNMVPPERSEGWSMRETAGEVMKALRDHNCAALSCGGDRVDASRITSHAEGPRSA